MALLHQPEKAHHGLIASARQGLNFKFSTLILACDSMPSASFGCLGQESADSSPDCRLCALDQENHPLCGSDLS